MQYDIEYFLSDEFNGKEEISMEEVWALDDLMPLNKFTDQTFSEMFVLVSDDGESWLNWNGKLKHVKQEVNDIVFF